ncbi:DUF6090 family protein [Yeosuana marina]|uniref:DUF6090 family protein n=1 Tax=Yeosuana marina TaxID=1565536 RepID=UPI00142470FB|nr:DUF6090 family protein [Yeosuana marina]
MIKFYRTKRYNFLKKNKLGKFLSYAIGEIILVVIGILIAININNWNEERKRREQEHKIILSLKSEFLESKELLLSTMKEQKNDLIRSDVLIQIYEGEKPLPKNDSIKKLIMKGALAWQREEIISGSYHVLISSGNSELVKNDELLKTLAEFYSFYQAGFEDNETSMNLKNEMLKILSPVILSLSKLNRSKGNELDTIPDPKEDDAIKYLLEQDAFFGLLCYKTYIEKLRYDYQEDLLLRINNIIEILKKELEKSDN